MTSVLVTYATRMGPTAEIARVSGPCGEGAQNESIETPRKVAKVIQSRGLQRQLRSAAGSSGRLRPGRSAAGWPPAHSPETSATGLAFAPGRGERADDLHHATVPRDGWTCRRGSHKITMNSVH
jgi:hypothetical protein